MKLSGRVAVVTGADGAIGSALVRALKSEGVACIEVDREAEYKCDFTDLSEVTSLSTKILAKHQNVDFLFNVAGIGIYKNISELSVSEWEDSFSVNVRAPFIFSKALLPILAKSESGMIFNVGSGMGVIAAPERSSYCSSKFALRGLSLSLSGELKAMNIDVCLLTLGSVMTPFGSGGIDKRRDLLRAGKKYLEVSEVVDKIIAITKSSKRENEYVMYPPGYI